MKFYNRINKDIKHAGELLLVYDNMIQTWLKLETKDVIIQKEEAVIEKIIENEPDEDKIRELISKNIQDYLPPQKTPEKIIQTETKIQTVYVQSEPDLLGKAYHLVYGSKNYSEALKILRELDLKNDPEAQCMLGVMYLEGIGLRKDKTKAIEFLKKSASAENPEALYRLACLLEVNPFKFTKKTKEIRRGKYKNSMTEPKLSNKLLSITKRLQ